LVQTYGLDAQAFAKLDAQLMNPDRDAETAQALQQLVPYLSDARAKSVVQQLRDEGTAEFPAPYRRLDQPVLCAYRLFDDIFFPTNTTDPQRCRVYLLREWLTEVELRERIVSYDYSEDFVDEVLKHEATTLFPMYRRNPTQGDLTAFTDEENKEAHKG